MAKDYGRRPSRQRSRAPKQVFWVLASFVVGYLAATVFDFTSLTTWINTQVLGQQDEQKIRHTLLQNKMKYQNQNLSFIHYWLKIEVHLHR
ncbi:hypothetical protein [Legionella tunisiensis]|uniref:hypothetical protein n=1 Tax=Legionella tunisiensis TaxID=1034944 RepID=UPI000688FFAC|nr:hypothetical protein [Legionella tunisiensis]